MTKEKKVEAAVETAVEEVKKEKPKFTLTIRLEGHKDPVVKSFDSQSALDEAKVELRGSKSVISFQ